MTATKISQLRKLLLSRQAGNISCRFTPVSHRAAGLPSFNFVQAAVYLQKLPKSCVAVTVCVQLLWCSRLCAANFEGSLLTSRNTGEIAYMLLAEAALQRKQSSRCPVHCTAAQYKSHSQLHSPSQGALVLHEEPQFAVKTDASWCTPVHLQKKAGLTIAEQGCPKRGKCCSLSCICTCACALR